MSDQDKKKCGWYGFTPDDNMTPNNIMISQESLCVSEYLNCKAYLIILMIQSAPWILISLFSKNVIKHDRVEKHLHSHKDSEASFSLLLCKLRIRKTFFQHRQELSLLSGNVKNVWWIIQNVWERKVNKK